jgi:hypothetical protein
MLRLLNQGKVTAHLSCVFDPLHCSAYRMTSSTQQILDQFEIVRRQRDAALWDLSQAQETITILEAELTAAKYYGDLAYAKVADGQGISKRQIERSPGVTTTNAVAWIDDIWLCSSDSSSILAPAEEAWRKNLHNPQSAILQVTEALKTKPVKKDRITCKLFMASIQFSVGSLEAACALVNDCIKECEVDPRFRDIAGIAYYIRGRIFLAMKIFPSAHWDFSMAVLTKGYHGQVKKWQGYCETCIFEGEGQQATEEDVQSSTTDQNS